MSNNYLYRRTGVPNHVQREVLDLWKANNRYARLSRSSTRLAVARLAKGKALLVLVDQDTTGTLTPVAQQFSA